MENNHVGDGHAALAVSILMGIFARIDVAETLKTVSLVISITAGLMAIRYYYYSTKKK